MKTTVNANPEEIILVFQYTLNYMRATVSDVGHV